MSMPLTDRLFLKLAKATLVLLYLVVIAGAVVRATGSGMGCPDWPKCFGYFIPPTDPSQIEFHSGNEYKKGMMIILNDTLWRTKQDFHSGEKFDHANWEKYPVHNYAKFFVAQTWTEYINRLFGALNSFVMLLLMIVAAARVRRDPLTFGMLLLGMFILAFVIWLGKVVVDTNLKPISITLHMMSAIALISVTIFSMTRVRKRAGDLMPFYMSRTELILLVIAAFATLDQVVFGTQVRQQIDTIHSNMSGLSRETWIGQLGGVYLYHKITAGIVMILNIVLFWMLYKRKPVFLNKILLFAMLLVVLGEYGAGVFMHNFSIPAYMQPVHLVLAMILFGVQFAILVRSKVNKVV